MESRGRLGGTCLNVGCIPSKALLNNSHYFHLAKHDFANRGIDVKGLDLNLPNMMKQKEKAVDGLTRGIEGLFKKNKVDYIKGVGKVSGPKEVTVSLSEGGNRVVRAKNIVIATGSEPSSFPGLTVDEKAVITSTGALSLARVPKHMIVIGGGIIGLELVRGFSCSFLFLYRPARDWPHRSHRRSFPTPAGSIGGRYLQLFLVAACELSIPLVRITQESEIPLLH